MQMLRNEILCNENQNRTCAVPPPGEPWQKVEHHVRPRSCSSHCRGQNSLEVSRPSLCPPALSSRQLRSHKTVWRVLATIPVENNQRQVQTGFPAKGHFSFRDFKWSEANCHCARWEGAVTLREMLTGPIPSTFSTYPRPPPSAEVGNFPKLHLHWPYIW